MKYKILGPLLSVSFALYSISTLAQETNSLENAPRLQEPEALSAPGWDANASASYVAAGTAKYQGAHLANSDAYNFKLGLGAQFPLDEKWFMHLGLASDNFYLGTVSSAPIPASIHTLHLNTALGYHLNDQWTLSAFLFPELYRLDQLGSDDLGLAGGVSATFKQSPSLIWTFGLMGAPDSDYKVLPIGGLRWQINARNLLEVGFPRTRYSYRLDQQWTLFATGDFDGTTFRGSDTLGTQINQPQFNRALGTYRDARIGVGVSYRILRGLNAELEGGYSVYRRLDYSRIDQEVDFDPAPYVRLGLNYRF